jgi:hypothetical protein
MIVINDFHNTEYRTRKSLEEIRRILDTPPWDRAKKDQAWVLKVKRQLCGIESCTCGDSLGARGSQNWEED